MAKVDVSALTVLAAVLGPIFAGGADAATVAAKLIASVPPASRQELLEISLERLAAAMPAGSPLLTESGRQFLSDFVRVLGSTSAQLREAEPPAPSEPLDSNSPFAGGELPDMMVILVDALDELAKKVPDVVSFFRGMPLTESKCARAILELRQAMREPDNYWRPEPPDPEEVALWDVVRIHGLNGFGLEGGGILGNGVPLSTLEGTALNVLEHLKKRVSESYEEGFRKGRESALIEWMQKASKGA